MGGVKRRKVRARRAFESASIGAITGGAVVLCVATALGRGLSASWLACGIAIGAAGCAACGRCATMKRVRRGFRGVLEWILTLGGLS